MKIISYRSFIAQARKAPIYALLPCIATISKVTVIPLAYANYTNVFSEEKADTLLSKRSCIYAIKLIKGVIPLYSLIYNLSKRELAVLKEYLKSSKEKE